MTSILRSYSTSNDGQTSIATPAGTVDGDLLVFMTGGEFDSAGTPTGYTNVVSSGTTVGHRMAFRIASGEPTNTTYTNAGSGECTTLLCYDHTLFSGTATGTPYRDDVDTTWDSGADSSTATKTSTINGITGTQFAIVATVMWFQAGGGFTGTFHSISWGSVDMVLDATNLLNSANTAGNDQILYVWEVADDANHTYTLTGGGHDPKISFITWGPGIAPAAASGTGDSWSWHI